MKLAGKTAIITGAGRGLGFAIAKRFAVEGANIVVADIRDSQRAADKLLERGITAIGIDTDVSQEEQVAAMVRATLGKFGAIDILVNNAAIGSAMELKPFEQLTVNEWQRVLAINTIGTFLCCRGVAPHMRERKSGRIVNLASAAAIRGAANMLHYVASKGAIISMTRALSRELGSDNITVNALSPGLTMTDGILMNKEWLSSYKDAAIASRALQRDAYPEDLVGTVFFLVSEDAAFMTGQILSVDGGAIYH